MRSKPPLFAHTLRLGLRSLAMGLPSSASFSP